MVRKPKRKIGGKIRLIYYISDIHFRDQNIFDKCERPFLSLNEMELKIIDNWNNVVNNDDVVYILGDIGNETNLSSIEIFKNLKGHKHLIVGNHDELILNEIKNINIFESIKYINLIMDNNRKVCICHYPLMDWPEFNRKGILVYGHIHNKTIKNDLAYKQIKNYYSDKSAYNCGVDVTNFIPKTLDELIKLKEINKNEPYIN